MRYPSLSAAKPSMTLRPLAFMISNSSMLPSAISIKGTEKAEVDKAINISAKATIFFIYDSPSNVQTEIQL